MAGAAASEAGTVFGQFSKKFAYQPKYPGGFSGTMSRREAFLILGLRCLPPWPSTFRRPAIDMLLSLGTT